MLAGLDGIQNRIDPGDPLDKNLYELPPEELANVPSVPDSLGGAIAALEEDHAFPAQGDVFNSDFITNWVEMKQKEYDALRLRPHPVRVLDVLRRVSVFLSTAILSATGRTRRGKAVGRTGILPVEFSRFRTLR